MRMLHKIKGQRDNRNPIETLAFYVLGREGWSRDSVLARARRGFDSPHVQPNLEILPAYGCSRTRGMSSDMSQGQGWKPTVILALSPGESKSQSDDLPQLQNRMQ